MRREMFGVTESLCGHSNGQHLNLFEEIYAMGSKYTSFIQCNCILYSFICKSNCKILIPIYKI